jgi:hypothetical protein
MPPKTIAIMVLAFILSGIGLMLFVIKTSESSRISCVEYCSSKNMDYVHAPTGTAGRAIDGTWNPTDVQSYCQCIPRNSDQVNILRK